MDSPNPGDLSTRIREAIFAGRKIEAIKLYREQTGLGLKDSKDAVEKLATELRVADPTRFTATQAKGCLPLILAGVSIAVFLTFA
jgi:ribosomal protein L7/L12